MSLTKYINSCVHIYMIAFIHITYITYYHQFSEGYLQRLQRVIIKVAEKQNTYPVYIK